MSYGKHRIRILTVRKQETGFLFKQIGFIFVEDKTQIVFNPSISGARGFHDTWPKDGKRHTKDNKGKILFGFQDMPLDKFKGSKQFLFMAQAKEADLNIDFKSSNDSSLFLIDLTDFQKGIGLSIHVCNYWNVNKTMQSFSDKPKSQSFIYWKSTPKIVINAFEN